MAMPRMEKAVPHRRQDLDEAYSRDPTDVYTRYVVLKQIC